MVRDFHYDPKAIQAQAAEKGKLEMQLKKQFVSCGEGLILARPIIHYVRLVLTKSDLDTQEVTATTPAITPDNQPVGWLLVWLGWLPLWLATPSGW